MENSELLLKLMSAATKTDSVTVQIGDESITLRYKKLGWLAKNRCLSSATEYSSQNPNSALNVTFHLDVYKALVLQEILIDPPFPLTPTSLEAIPEEVGVVLDTIIPLPFDTGAEKVSNMGKESEPSSGGQ